MSKAINKNITCELFAGITTLTILNTELTEQGLPEQTDPVIAALLLAAGIRSQGEFASMYINLNEGDVTGDEMTETLKCAFPGAKVSERHGPHQLCAARTGSLKDCRFKPLTANERKGKKSKASKIDPTSLSVEQLGRMMEWKQAEAIA